MKIKLFCFPYAGGSALIYNKWEKYLAPEIELVPVELAGRGKRINEPFYKDMPETVEDVFQIIKEEITQSPYALFGHSLGGTIAYELAQKIRRFNLASPLHFFFSGKRAHHIRETEKKIYHLMNEADFRRELFELGGTPPEFFENEELLSLFLPLLRNDFKLAETEPRGGPICPLDGDITVFLGRDETFSPEECDGWKRHTRRLCSIHYLDGGHFFLHDHTEKMVKMINDTLRRSYKERSAALAGIHDTF